MRSATDLTLPAIIASVTASADFISQLLPSRLRQVSGPAFVNVQNSWLSDDVSFHLSAVHSHHGTGPLVKLKFDNICQLHNLQSAEPDFLRLHHLVLEIFEYNSVFVCMGRRIGNTSFRIETELRLGAPICAPINASAEKTSTNMVFMVCHPGGLPVVIRDTAPSMTS